MYVSTVWSTCSSENLERVCKLQKRQARVILDVDTRVRSTKLFKDLNWLPFARWDENTKVLCFLQ